MDPITGPLPEIFSTHEVAVAAGVQKADVGQLIRCRQILAVRGDFLVAEEAVRAVQLLRGQLAFGARPDALFRPLERERPRRTAPLAASGAGHLLLVGGLILLTSLGMSKTPPQPRTQPASHLVFLALPGPGGGGGGGGQKAATPPPRAALKGSNALRSPVSRPPLVRKAATQRVPKRTPPPPQPTERTVESPPAPAAVPPPTPPVVAPVASAPADEADRAGVLTGRDSDAESRGAGSGSGVGTGEGSGLGEGEGSGVGPGSGGGYGGGPYRPGSGITPPGLLREVRPEYTEEARRRGLEGEVLLEIVVRRDGTVGSLRLVEGLGGGLDQRAVDAVRQWRFSPAMRRGSPVDVMVEVAVEFRLR